MTNFSEKGNLSPHKSIKSVGFYAPYLKPAVKMQKLNYY